MKSFQELELPPLINMPRFQNFLLLILIIAMHRYDHHCNAPLHGAMFIRKSQESLLETLKAALRKDPKERATVSQLLAMDFLNV